MERQDKRAGSGSVVARDFVVGDELNGMNDVAFVVEIDEVVRREAGNGGNAFEGIEPKSRHRIWFGLRRQAFDESLYGLEWLGLRIDDDDAECEATGAGLVVDAVISRRHRALVPAKVGATE